MQRDFKHPGDDLNAAREALRRREDEGEIFSRDAAITRDFFDDFARRRAVGFKHECRARRACRDIPIRKTKAPCGRARGRALSQARKMPICLRHATAPSPHIGWQGRRSTGSVVRTQSSKGHFGLAPVGARSTRSQAAKADFGDREARLDSAAGVLAGVDNGLARFPLATR